MRYVFLFFAFSISFYVHPQTVMTGRVVDADSKESLPFVNIAIQGKNYGSSSNIDGAFQVNASSADSIILTYVGYETKTVLAYSVSEIFLKAKAETLKEVEVLAGENPAWPIIRKAITNRALNDPNNLSSYHYKAYHKLFATVEGAFDTLSDQSVAAGFLENQHLFFNETISERKYIRPNLEKETVLANKMSGIKDPFFAVLATTFQPFSFYTEHIDLLDKHYINPIAEGTFNRYDFFLEDSVLHENSTTYILSFTPLKGKTFDALHGLLFINTRHYAIEKVLAAPFDPKSLATIKLQQNYSLFEDHWFPTELNTEIIFKEQKISERPLKYVHRSYFSEIKINPTLSERDFGILNVEYVEGANKRTAEYWKHSRLDSLTTKEKNTFSFYDSLPPKRLQRLNSFFNAFEAIATGKFKVGKLYIPLEHLVRNNAYENLRIGVGIQTGEDISKSVEADGYLGYGLRDQGLKFGLGLKIKLLNKSGSFFRISYLNDVLESGNSLFFRAPSAIASAQSIRNWLASRMDSVTRVKAQLNFRPVRFAEASMFVQRSSHNPTYAYGFQSAEDEVLHQYILAEAGFQFKFLYGEKFTQIGRSHIVTDYKYPHVNFSLSRAIRNVMDGDFSFTRFEGKFDYSIITLGAGTTSLSISAGYIHGNAPYFSLFNGKGTNTGTFDVNSLVAPNHFQTMGVYEFTSDRYANLFFTHDFGRLVSTGLKFFRPELLVAQNIGLGELRTAKRQVIAIKTLEDGFFESGMFINNFIRFNYFNFGYIGIGGGVFFRYGPNQLENQRENFVKKFSLTFGL